MSDLPRLLDSSEDELALSLLRSAHEEPPEGSMARVAAALGVSGALVSGASATALLASKAHAAATGATTALGVEATVASSPWLLSVVAKPLAVGLIGGLAAISGVSYVSSKPELAASAPRTARPSAALVAQPDATMQRSTPPSAPSPIPEAREAESPSEPPLRGDGAAPRTPPRRDLAAPVRREAQPLPLLSNESSFEPALPAAPAAAVRAPSPPRDEALARELRVLARARSLLVAGDAAGALRALDQYSAERRSGALEPEAMTLRIQALARAGDRKAAARLARAFLEAHPERSHDDSLRSLAGQAR